MKKNDIDGERPLYTITIGEFCELLDRQLDENQKNNQAQPMNQSGASHLVYGLRGIRQLFGCSHKTAQYYKDYVIQEAVYQNGRKIVVDADLAMRLFDERKGKRNERS